MKVATSFLSCKNVLKTVKKLDKTTANYIHVDFIDNTYCKGRKIPFRVLKKINKYTTKRIDVHLMTKKLKKYIKKFSFLNVEYLTFHIDATSNIDKYIALVHSYGIKVGLALNPDIGISKLFPYLEDIDLVLMMGVNPGKGGQVFNKDTVSKLKDLKNIIDKNKYKVKISVDGGINKDTKELVKNYTDIVVAGSYITNSDNYQEKVKELKEV